MGSIVRIVRLRAVEIVVESSTARAAQGGPGIDLATLPELVPTA
jgi:hypothetical protein